MLATALKNEKSPKGIQTFFLIIVVSSYPGDPPETLKFIS
jgi:hypothetical protein